MSADNTPGGRKRRRGRPTLLHDPKEISVCVETRQLDKLDALSLRNGVSRPALIRDAIDAYLARPKK